MGPGIRLLFLILPVVIICSTENLSQQQGTPESEFTIFNPQYEFTVFSPRSYLSKYTMGGYYSRWEAEQDRFALFETGVKHLNNGMYGQPEEYDGVMCWASENNLQQTMSKFQFGPNYRQEKKYYWIGYQGALIPYRTTFRMGLTGGEEYSPSTVVCTLRVVYSYFDTINNMSVKESVELGASRVLRVSDFSGTVLDTFQIIYNYEEASFDTVTYTDDIPETGVEFIIDYEGTGKLYVDYVEVYDDLIWREYVSSPAIVTSNIEAYCEIYKNTPHLIYRQSFGEPYNIDSYIPNRIVDSIVTEFMGKEMSRVTYPYWLIVRPEGFIPLP